MDDAGSTHNPAPLPKILRDILVFRDPAEVAHHAARRFVEWAWQFIAREGSFNVALAGGNTPRELYRMLAGNPFRSQVDWARMHLFWTDERVVSPDHDESNCGMVRRELLVRIPVPLSNVHRMEADRPNLGRAAQDYEDILRRWLPLDGRGFPRFHLILLGLGRDGHTASLFPGNHKLRETSRWVSTPLHPKLGSRRMTLTLSVLNAAHVVLFLVTGEEKAEALRDVLEATCDPPLPGQLVTVPNGRRIFLVDEAAASLLRQGITSSSSPVESGGAKPKRSGKETTE